MAPRHTTDSGDRRRVIFLIADDVAVVNLTSRLLEWLGYRVEPYTEAMEAAQIFEKNPKAYDVVIIDLTMPCSTGLWLARRMHRLNPQLPILFYTNKYSGPVKDGMKQFGVVGYLRRPLGLDEIKRTLAQALAGTPHLQGPLPVVPPGGTPDNVSTG